MVVALGSRVPAVSIVSTPDNVLKLIKKSTDIPVVVVSQLVPVAAVALVKVVAAFATD